MLARHNEKFSNHSASTALIRAATASDERGAGSRRLTASSSAAARSLADDRAELSQRRDAALSAVRRMLQARGLAVGAHSGLLVPWGLKVALAGPGREGLSIPQEDS